MTSEDPAQDSPRPTRRLALWLFIFFQALYLLTASGRVRIPDEQEVYFQAESLIDRGELAVPQALQARVFFGKVGKDGKPYAPYGPATAVFALPHHLLARGFVSALDIGADPARDGPQRFYVLSTLTSLATSTAAALAVLFFFLIASTAGSQRQALVWSLLLGAATFLWSYGTSFFGEAFTALALTAAAWALLEDRWPRVILGGALFSLAVLCKAPLVIYAPAFAAFVWLRFPRDRRWPALLTCAALAALACIGHLLWNHWRFGAALDFGYDWGETIQGQPRPFAGSPLTALFGLTLSPGKGLLFFAPPLVLALIRLKQSWQRHRALAALAGACLLIGLGFYAFYVFWAGGYCLGPRHLLPILPLALLPGALVPPTASSPGLIWLKRGAIALAVLQQLLFVQVSFLEDQAVGQSFDRQSPYYRLVRNQEPGLPRNVYRLGYTPQLTYPPRALRGWREVFGGPSTGFGLGVDQWAVFLWKVSRQPWGRSLPMWWIPPVLLAALTALTAAGLGLRRLSGSPEGSDRAPASPGSS